MIDINNFGLLMDASESVRVGLAKRNVKNAWLAAKLGSTNQYITNLKNGNAKIGIGTIEKLAAAFDVPVSEFIKWGED